jgi:hypothetical protein
MKVDLGLAVGLAITALPQPFNVPLLGAALTVHAVRSLRRAVKAKREERKESAGGGFGEKVQHPRFGAWVTVADTLHQPDLPREIAGTHAASCLHAGVVAAELQPGGPEERRREEGAAQQLTWSCSAGSVAGADGQQRRRQDHAAERAGWAAAQVQQAQTRGPPHRQRPAALGMRLIMRLLRIERLGVGTGRQRMARERWTNPRLAVYVYT